MSQATSVPIGEGDGAADPACTADGALLFGTGWNLLALGSGDLPLYLKRIWRNRERLAVDPSAALFLGSVGLRMCNSCTRTSRRMPRLCWRRVSTGMKESWSTS